MTVWYDMALEWRASGFVNWGDCKKYLYKKNYNYIPPRSHENIINVFSDCAPMTKEKIILHL